MPTPRATCGIRISETIAQRRLVREHPIAAAFETLMFISMFGSPFLLLVHVTELDLSRANNQVLAFVLAPITAVFCLFVVYRSLTENQFQRTSSSLSATANKQVVLHLLQRQGIRPRQTGRGYVVAASEGNYPGAAPCTMVFLIDEKRILSGVLTTGGPLGGSRRLPTLIGHFLLQHDLRQAIKAH